MRSFGRRYGSGWRKRKKERRQTLLSRFELVGKSDEILRQARSSRLRMTIDMIGANCRWGPRKIEQILWGVGGGEGLQMRGSLSERTGAYSLCLLHIKF